MILLICAPSDTRTHETATTKIEDGCLGDKDYESDRCLDFIRDMFTKLELHLLDK